jgi:hypothetical protein
MTITFRTLVGTAAACAIVCCLGQSHALAQQPQGIIQGASQGGIDALPPALRNAVISGDASNIASLIAALAQQQPQAAASLAEQVIDVAAQLLQTNPSLAVELAGQAVQAVSSQTVAQSQPAQAANVATIAARIIVQPSVIQANPTVVAQVAITVTQLISVPAVYQVAPQTSIQSMANCYAAVTNNAVIAAVPGAVGTVTGMLNAASQATPLAQANATNSAQVNAILAGQIPPSQSLDDPTNGSGKPTITTQAPSVDTVTAPPTFTVSPT